MNLKILKWSLLLTFFSEISSVAVLYFIETLFISSNTLTPFKTVRDNRIILQCIMEFMTQ